MRRQRPKCERTQRAHDEGLAGDSEKLAIENPVIPAAKIFSEVPASTWLTARLISNTPSIALIAIAAEMPQISDRDTAGEVQARQREEF